MPGLTVNDQVFRRFVVRVRRADGGSGSGVLVAPGWVLTCAHVVAEPGTVVVEFHPLARESGSYAADDLAVDGMVTHMSPRPPRTTPPSGRSPTWPPSTSRGTTMFSLR
ncbi:MAG: hypothetical protein IPH03_18625 [Tetrasphaera sp.]|nr:hypothetical protein [Tetrasphaera sp.]